LWEYKEEIETGKYPALAVLLPLLEEKPTLETVKKENEILNKTFFFGSVSGKVFFFSHKYIFYLLYRVLLWKGHFPKMKSI
jgi:hypothetical protein